MHIITNLVHHFSNKCWWQRLKGALESRVKKITNLWHGGLQGFNDRTEKSDDDEDDDDNNNNDAHHRLLHMKAIYLHLEYLF
ncbi:MAG: hypothetical protein WBL68_18390 [Nitrososphaeraceae archaeon]